MNLLIDATNYCHTLWAGTSGRTNLAQSLLSLASHFQERHQARVTAVFDGLGLTWRHELYPEYKAGRTEKPKELLDALEEARRACDREEIIGPEIPGYEADDIIATLATGLIAKGKKVVVCSRDRDLWQLLEAGKLSIIRQANRVQGQWDCRFITADMFVKETRLIPAQWPDYRALAGDASDNWPGAPGIGTKTAETILATAGSLERAVANPWNIKITERIRDSLLAFDWRLGLRLMTLKRDVEMGVLA